jgi:hypothetical protein
MTPASASAPASNASNTGSSSALSVLVSSAITFLHAYALNRLGASPCSWFTIMKSAGRAVSGSAAAHVSST